MKLSIVVIIFAPYLWAQEKVPKICDEMASFTCGPGTYNDGTGEATSARNKIDEAMSFAKRRSKELASELVKNADPRLRNILLSSTGLKSSPFCESSDPEELKSCNDQLVIGAAEFLEKLATSSRSGEGDYQKLQTAGLSYSDLKLLGDNPKFKRAQTQLVSELTEKLVDRKQFEKARKDIFPKVRQYLIEKIRDSVDDPNLRQQLVDKVEAIEMSDRIGCGPGNNAEDQKLSVAPLFESNASYQRDPNTFKICNGSFLNNSSEFTLVSAMAHELAHSIDPCGITIGPSGFTFSYPKDADQQTAEEKYPFRGIIKCLRSDKSVQALRINLQNTGGIGPYPGATGVGMPPMGVGMPLSGGMGPMGAGANPPQFSGFCSGEDQISESVADWFSAEVTATYFDKYTRALSSREFQLGYSNIFRGSCYAINGGFDVHPNTDRRINSIILVQPKIRKQMGCPPTSKDYVYCPLDKSTKDDDSYEGGFTR